MRRAYLDEQNGVLAMKRWRELEEGWTKRIELISRVRGASATANSSGQLPNWYAWRHRTQNLHPQVLGTVV